MPLYRGNRILKPSIQRRVSSLQSLSYRGGGGECDSISSGDAERGTG